MKSRNKADQGQNSGKPIFKGLHTGKKKDPHSLIVEMRKHLNKPTQTYGFQ